jgi:hypothetical protein
MNLLLDSFWRALAYCLRPGVIALSFVPLLLMATVSAALVYFGWEPAVQAVQRWLDDMALLESFNRWLDMVGVGHLRSVAAPLLVLMLALPAILILSLLSVAWLMTPTMVSVVAQRRFPELERRRGSSFWRGMLLSLIASLQAAMALLLTLPLWLIPPLVLVLPPLIWGWLTYRVMTHDVLSEHASAQEYVELIERHRAWLLMIGVLTGLLGAAPGMVWAVGAMAIVMAPVLAPLAIWLYTLVFVFSALWFAHYCLHALNTLRAEAPGAAVASAPYSLNDLSAPPNDLHGNTRFPA